MLRTDSNVAVYCVRVVMLAFTTISVQVSFNTVCMTLHSEIEDGSQITGNEMEEGYKPFWNSSF